MPEIVDGRVDKAFCNVDQASQAMHVVLHF